VRIKEATCGGRVGLGHLAQGPGERLDDNVVAIHGKAGADVEDARGRYGATAAEGDGGDERGATPPAVDRTGPRADETVWNLAVTPGWTGEVAREDVDLTPGRHAEPEVSEIARANGGQRGRMAEDQFGGGEAMAGGMKSACDGQDVTGGGAAQFVRECAAGRTDGRGRRTAEGVEAANGVHDVIVDPIPSDRVARVRVTGKANAAAPLFGVRRAPYGEDRE
jgi:hypothetical protein